MSFNGSFVVRVTQRFEFLLRYLWLFVHLWALQSLNVNVAFCHSLVFALFLSCWISWLFILLFFSSLILVVMALFWKLGLRLLMCFDLWSSLARCWWLWQSLATAASYTSGYGAWILLCIMGYTIIKMA